MSDDWFQIVSIGSQGKARKVETPKDLQPLERTDKETDDNGNTTDS